MNNESAKLAGLEARAGAIFLRLEGQPSVERPISSVRRLICVRCGDSFHSECEDFLVAEMEDGCLVMPCELVWYGSLLSADDHFLERSSRVFQGHCGRVPRQWKERQFFRSTRAVAALRSVAELVAAMQTEGGLKVESEPTTFDKVEWSD